MEHEQACLHRHRDDSNDATCAVVPVHCIPLHAKASCRPSILTVISAKSLVSYLRLSTIYSDDSSALHVMVYKVLGGQHR